MFFVIIILDGAKPMANQITTDEVANQFARAIKLLLEWAKQEFQSRSTPPVKDTIPVQAFPESGKLLKATEIAKILQVSRSTAYQMMLRNDIPTVHIGKAVRVRQSDLDEFINRRGQR
jgi:excisionase family DNA binding protein